MPSLPTDQLTALLQQLQAGALEIPQVIERLAHTGIIAGPTGVDVDLDLDRRRRCGFPEVIYGPGKSPAALVAIFQRMLQHDQSCFATRVNPEQVAAVCQAIPTARHNAIAQTLRADVWSGSASAPSEPEKSAGFVAVITAGTSDRPVAAEAAETSRWMGCRVDLIVDVGVAGPHRLPAQKHRFEQADAIVVVAGMEAALPSVVGGYVACPVIGGPASVGYGAKFQGLAALLGMINSCAANVTVVNIDGGFKGGFVAGLIARRSGARLAATPDP
jgi:NCAIR mutase (PurE)-related protein